MFKGKTGVFRGGIEIRQVFRGRDAVRIGVYTSNRCVNIRQMCMDQTGVFRGGIKVSFLQVRFEKSDTGTKKRLSILSTPSLLAVKGINPVSCGRRELYSSTLRPY